MWRSFCNSRRFVPFVYSSTFLYLTFFSFLLTHFPPFFVSFFLPFFFGSFPSLCSCPSHRRYLKNVCFCHNSTDPRQQSFFQTCHRPDRRQHLSHCRRRHHLMPAVLVALSLHCNSHGSFIQIQISASASLSLFLPFGVVFKRHLARLLSFLYHRLFSCHHRPLHLHGQLFAPKLPKYHQRSQSPRAVFRRERIEQVLSRRRMQQRRFGL